VLLCLGAYGMWGLAPLYWPLVRRADAPEIVAHRITWSIVVLLSILGLQGKLGSFWRIGTRRLSLLVFAALLIGINWGLYIWAVNHGRVVETALGYFINPLVTVMLGVFVLGERLRRAQWIAIGLAGVAVTVLALRFGGVPWIALVLAASFAAYGLVKRHVGIGAVESLTIETIVLVAPAAVYLCVREARGTGAFGHLSTRENVLLVLSGVVTTAPLLCFAGAATRVSFTTLGLLQYLSPTLQFLLGVFVFREPMPPARWFCFSLVWGALLLFALDVLRRRPNNDIGTMPPPLDVARERP
jgi:chloramphenicol-sensitive protein RarD